MAEFTLYEDMEKVKDSMQFDSGTVICALKDDDLTAEIVVRGEVRVDWCPSGDFTDGQVEEYRTPSEFPEPLKKIIAQGYPDEIDLEENDIQSEFSWTRDKRVCIGNNNWFEVFVDDKTGNLMYDVVDIEGETAKELEEDCRLYIEEATRKGRKENAE